MLRLLGYIVIIALFIGLTLRGAYQDPEIAYTPKTVTYQGTSIRSEPEHLGKPTSTDRMLFVGQNRTGHPVKIGMDKQGVWVMSHETTTIQFMLSTSSKPFSR